MTNEHSPQKRKRFSPEEKFKIVKEQMMTKTSISEICKKYGITPSSYYGWQEQFFSGALAAFDKKRGPKSQSKDDPEVRELQRDILRAHEVIAEITAENIAFKKKNSPYLR